MLTLATRYNVKVTNYAGGAFGDGIHDDTVAINAAISACVAAGGGVVYFPAGNYKITGTLVASSYLTFQGDGVGNAGVPSGTQLSMSDVTGNTNVIANAGGTDIQHFTVRDMTIYSGNGSPTGSGSAIKLNWNSLGSVPYCEFLNLKIVNFGGAGIDITNPIVTNFVNVIVQGGNSYGFYMHSSAGAWTSVSFNACYALSNASDGFRMDTGTYFSMQGCAADHNTANGYHIINCQGATLLGCGAEYISADSATANGWQIDGASTGISLVGCFSFQQKHYMVYVTGNSNATLISCTENTPLGSAVNSFKSDAGSNVILIEPHNTTAYNLGGNYWIMDTTGQLAVSGGGGTALSTTDVYGNLTAHAALAVSLGQKFQVTEGSNAKMGTATLNGTTGVTVSTTAVTANSRIYLTIQPTTAPVGIPWISAKSAGVSFTIKSTSASDTTVVVAWLIVEPS
jgi:hypothetical protein